MPRRGGEYQLRGWTAVHGRNDLPGRVTFGRQLLGRNPKSLSAAMRVTGFEKRNGAIFRFSESHLRASTFNRRRNR